MADNENLGAPQSRNEALLQNILGANYDLGEPQSRNEALLMKIAGEDVDVDFEPQSRIEALLMEIIDQGGGGGVEVEPLSVTKNGTYTAETGKAYSPVTVNVSGTEDDLLENKLSGAYRNDRITTLRRFAFSYVTGITSIFLGNLTEIQGADPFSYCSAETIVLPKFGIPSWSGGNYLFRDSRSTKTFDLSNTGGIQVYAFNACTSLNTLILRSNTLVPLASANVFNGSLFENNKSGGTLYVPQALISSYQSATNWSTILGYANNQIKSIESTHTDPNAPIDLTLYYADGTPIS